MPQVVYANREMIISSFVALACLFLSSFFPAQGTYQNLAVLAAFLVAIPLLYVKFILKQSLSDFEIQWGDWRRGLLGAGTSLAISLLLVYVLLNYTEFLKTQNFLAGFKNDFGGFIFYEFFFVGTLVAVFEFFFRGFVLKTFSPRFGNWAVLIQLISFAVYALLTKSFNLEMAYFFIIALFSGMIVLYSRSILYSIVYGWIFFLIADAIAIRLIR